MSIILSILILVAMVVVALWLIRMIPFPAELEILRTIITIIIVVYALIRLFNFL